MALLGITFGVSISDTRCGTFDDFVEFTAIEPNPATLRTIIDFYTVAVSH
jgi:hypothetical protein